MAPRVTEPLRYPVRLFRRLCRPDPAPDFERPADYGLTAQDFQVRAADGVLLSGWVFEPADPWGVVVLCHARGASKSRVLRQAGILYERGLTVVAFDFRGCGRSESPPHPYWNSMRGPLRDLSAVLAYTRQRLAAQPALRGRVAVMGCSFGGNMALAHAGTAAQVPPPAMILDSTPLIHWRSMLQEQLSKERQGSRWPGLRAAVDHLVMHAVIRWTRAEALYRCAQRSAARLAETRLLLIVGERDGFFDISESCRFLERHYAGPAEVWRVRRGRHLTNHLVDRQRYGERVERFLRAAFPSAPPTPTPPAREPTVRSDHAR